MSPSVPGAHASKPVHGAQAFGDALGVIDAVDTHEQGAVRQPILLAERGGTISQSSPRYSAARSGSTLIGKALTLVS